MAVSRHNLGFGEAAGDVIWWITEAVAFALSCISQQRAVDFAKFGWSPFRLPVFPYLAFANGLMKYRCLAANSQGQRR